MQTGLTHAHADTLHSDTCVHAVDITEKIGRTKKRVVSKTKYRMVPLLSGTPLLQTDDKESQRTPYRKECIDSIIRIIILALKALSIAHSKHGKKTTLLRSAAIGLLAFCGGMCPMLANVCLDGVM